MLLVLVVPAHSQSVSISYNGCNSVTVTSNVNVPQNLFLKLQQVTCGTTKRWLQGASIPGAKYILQKLNGSTWSEVGNSGLQYQSDWTFNNLSVGIYRGILRINLTDGTPVYSTVNPCYALTGYWHNGLYSQSTSSSIEVGSPSVSATLWDNSGTIGNGVFCQGASIVLDGSASYGEAEW